RLFLGGEMKDSDPSWIKKIYGMLSEVNYTKEELEMIGETRYLNDIWEELIEEEKQKTLEEKQKASEERQRALEEKQRALEEKQRASAAEKKALEAEEKALETERQLAKEREERLRLEEQIKELMKEAR
ncbi:MAG: hypothetical protein LBL26_11560, partial [Peptococcaceae bacterium]|nr:hypothetical protein [Peptococcaceae bacterium]